MATEDRFSSRPLSSRACLFVFYYLFFFCLLRLLPRPSAAIPQGPHINNLNVLLPPRTTHPVRFRLQGSGGCFTWTWDHHDLIHVQPEFSGSERCSENAVITSIAPYTGRRATAVYARDVVTGQVIRCEVFIDKVSSIKISHHSLKIDLDGLATLRIHGFDVEDNMFSSLVGIQISWRFLYSESSMGTVTHCLVHVPLKNTALSDCGCICEDIDTRIELEEKGYGSDLFVVRGVSVGHERVSANVIEPTMEALEDEISLTVAEAISIEPPSPLYVLVDSQFQYTLKTLRYKVPSAIQLPSTHHRWSVMDSVIAKLDHYTGKISTKAVGSTEIMVEDIRLTGHKQFSSLHVVTPSSLQMYLAPLGLHNASQQTAMERETFICSSDLPWYLIAGWDYVVQVMAFSDESSTTPLYITQGNDLKFSFEEWPYWKALSIPEEVQREQGWHNGTFIKAVSEGTGTIAASLKYKRSLMHHDEALSVDQEIIVCSPVLVLFENGKHADVLGLPWHPAISQSYQLKVHGGCGIEASDYQWVSLDPKIASVNALGVVYVKGEGQTVVRAMGLTNPMNADEVKVRISYPSSILRIEDFPLEIEVGSYLPAAITMRNSDGNYYTKCESFSSVIKWKMTGEEKAFVQVDSVEIGGNMLQEIAMVTEKPVCDLKFFRAIQAGRAIITASLPTDELESFSTSRHLVSWTISAYAPLTILQAGVGHSHGGYDCGVGQSGTSGNPSVQDHCKLDILQLVPKTSMKVMLRGGPERWGQGSEFIERHEVISSQGADVEGMHVSHLTSGGGRLYDLYCGAIGNYTVTFYRGNLAGIGHPVPTIATVNLTVICGDPSAISLIVDDIEHSFLGIQTTAQTNRNAKFVHETPITVTGGRSLRVAAVALNSFGIPFANASSLPISWILSDCLGLAYWEGQPASKVLIENARWEENLVLTDNPGQCLLRASVGLLSLDIQTTMENIERRLYILTDAVQLQIVTSLRVSPKFLLLYNHPEAKGSFSVLGGSSHIEADVNDTKVAFVIEQPHAPDNLHMMVAARGLGAALVTVHDIGLISAAFDSAVVSVADLAWVHLLLPEDASIQVGSALTVKLQAGDSLGNIFSDSQLELMNFEVHIKDEILEHLSMEHLDHSLGDQVHGSEFTIRGVNVGVTDLYVSASQKYGHDIVSELRKVEVYEPLLIQPEGLVLTPGAHYVVKVHGGPSVGTSISFVSSNDTIASVEQSLGMITANFPGTLFIYAEAITQSGLVVCKATLEVKIHIPTAMSLNVRGGQIAVGRNLVVFPMGIQEDILSFYELCGNYRWRIEDSEVLSFWTSDSPKQEENNEITAPSNRYAENPVDAGFSAVVSGKSAGKTDIHLEFSCHFHSDLGYSSTHSYSAAGTVHVIPDPPLALGMCATWLLPPSYRTSALLRQSSETGVESTSITKRNIVYSVLQDSSRDPMGISLDGAHIRTSERKDVACIQSRDRRTGRSEIAVCIRVAEVSQIIAGDIENSIRRIEMSVGAHQSCSVTLQDDIGLPFFEVGDAIRMVAETNRLDVVSIKVKVEDDEEHARNATILIQALRQGTAMVRISLMGNPTVADYILVHVGAFIFPRNPTLHIGGSVNFSIAANRQFVYNGYWLTSNADVLKINKHSGEAYAVGPGSALVTYDSSHLTAYTTASVVQITSILLKAPKGLLSNVHIPEGGYLFPVKFSGLHGQEDVGAFATDQRVSFSCHIDPPYIGRVLAFQDPADEKTYCVLQPYSPERLFLTLQSLAEETGTSIVVGDAKGRLTIKITAAVHGMPDSGSVEAPFAGGFQIRDKQTKIRLTPAANKTKLTIVGSAGAVLVSWSKSDGIEVKRISRDRDAYGFGGHAIFEISLIAGDLPFISNVVFRLPTTGQKEEILVEYDLKDYQSVGVMRQIVTALIAAVVLGIIPLIVCARLFDIPRRRHQQLQESDNVDGDYTRYESPRSPPGSLTPAGFPSPQSVTLSRSPPQPYTDYVSKTIDHTPYFRREGLRRYDPSRTY